MEEKHTEFKDYAEMQEDMILRDYLAYDRTKLALTRTFLSILRTVLGFFATGAGLIIIKENDLLVMIGYALMGIAFVVLIWGMIYCRQYRKRLNELKE
ncbi:MAG: DUF202 domain-containing protein [Butyrivibrio sp.]|nr:DUF202 domain-containing protein [Butyrivibrio sp.]